MVDHQATGKPRSTSVASSASAVTRTGRRAQKGTIYLREPVMPSPYTRALLISIALLVGLVAGLAAGMLARLAKTSYADAAARGGAAFIVTTPVVVLLMQAAGILTSP
ncbi:hypothetical protein M8Z33_00345 [Streptomyces sp. ZAF1911]|uniref:hypothetical protein n=1 Tax=Streptomyces sp. ZAF1911 TaxID=2944129 RepID=UPI00237A645D|nr:hypothetical protein [Streptomyces sp. ZAF1911]MDD9375144.1 hypothetical protein [Streptomyces sp. ZAF1911]